MGISWGFEAFSESEDFARVTGVGRDGAERGASGLERVSKRDSEPFTEQFAAQASLPAPRFVARQLMSYEAKGVFYVLAAGKVDLKDHVQSSMPTVICADQVVVSSAVRTRGQAISISCRVLEFLAGGAIDTNGSDSTVTYEDAPRPSTPTQPGGNGVNGMDGGNGGKAGDVLIACDRVEGIAIVTAIGGRGGTPQDGGHGQDGIDGKDGDTFPDVNSLHYDGPPDVPAACHATPGTDGGDIGLPGRRGAGGDGGQVILRCANAPAAQPRIDTRHGAHGRAARPGIRGKGGRSASGGEYRYVNCYPEGDPDLHRVIWHCDGSPQSVFGNDADGGESGRTFDEVVAERSREPVAKPGRVEAGVAPDAKLAAHFAIEPLEIMIWETEDQYRRSGGVADALWQQRLTFLHRMCQAEQSNDRRRIALGARLASLARKAAGGLDYYGYSISDAPLLTYKTYANDFTSPFIASLFAIEQSLQAFADAKTLREGWKDAAAKSLQAGRGAQAQAKTGLEQAMSVCQSLDVEIGEKQSAMDQAQRVLESGRSALDEAIRRRAANPQCDLASVLVSAAAIYAIVQSAGTLGPAVGEIAGGLRAAHKFFDDHSGLKAIWKNFNVLKKELTRIETGAGTIDKAITNIQKNVLTLKPEDARLPKFSMEKAHFDAVAREFAELPEAAAYREAGYAFLQAAAARNQAIIDFNASLLRLVDMQLIVADCERAVASLESALNRGNNPAFDLLFANTCRLYDDAMRAAAVSVHRERKALAYHLNRHERVAISELNATTINDASMRTREEWRRVKERFRPDLPVNPKSLKIDLRTLTDGADSMAWSEFRRTGELAFLLRRDHPQYAFRFKHLPALRVTGLQLVVSGAVFRADAGVPPGEDQIFWSITHSGFEEVETRNGDRLQYHHVPMRIEGSSSISGTPGEQLIISNFLDGGLYAGVSPFTTWRLVFADWPLYLPGEDFSVSMQLTGYLSGGE